MADDFFEAPPPVLEGLRGLGRRVPIMLHGLGLGIASVEPPEEWRLQALARLVRELEPENWSEHLAFVRAGGIELHHLAVPPRRRETIDATVRNLRRAREVVGSPPLMENVATIVEPPGSELDEADWLCAILTEADVLLLLDLQNVHANALNFGFDAHAFLRRLPLDRVGAIHLAGGVLIDEPGGHGPQRLLDDHLHPVSDEVFALLEWVAAHTPQPLTAILERDGAYPPMKDMLAELDRARACMQAGRVALAASQATP